MFLTLDENFSTYFYKTFSTNIDKLSTAVLYYNIYIYIYILQCIQLYLYILQCIQYILQCITIYILYILYYIEYIYTW